MLPLDSKFREWDSVRGLAAKTAHHVYTRILAANLQHRVSLEDLMQECAATWLIAQEKFDPSYGFAFTTYLYKAMYTNLNRFVKQQGNLKHGETVCFVGLNDSVDEGLEQQEKIAGEYITPEMLLDVETEIKERSKNLSPAARQVYEWLLLPPDWLRDEAIAGRAMAIRQYEAGKASKRFMPSCRQSINSVLERVWGLEKNQIRAIHAELETIL